MLNLGLVSDTAIEFNGLTVVQVSQNQAAVISDPQVYCVDTFYHKHSLTIADIRIAFSSSRILVLLLSQSKVRKTVVNVRPDCS